MMTRLLICSTVLRPGLKPACSSASSSSAVALSRLRITWSMILLEWLVRLMKRSHALYSFAHELVTGIEQSVAFLDMQCLGVTHGVTKMVAKIGKIRYIFSGLKKQEEES